MKVLHVGLHKTGSTYLQQEVFPRLNGVNYYAGGDIVRNWRSGLRPILGNTALWSTEAALGWPYPQPEPPRITELITLCHDLGVSHILVVKRDFPAWVRSVWFQTLNEGGREPLQCWYHRNKEGLDAWRGVFRDLHAIGTENRLCLEVVRHEDLVNSPERVVVELADFLGASIPDDISFRKRSNVSHYGAAFVAAYIALNSVVRSKRLRRWLSIVKMSPRIQMQHGPIGSFLQMVSTNDVAIPQELANRNWIEPE